MDYNGSTSTHFCEEHEQKWGIVGTLVHMRTNHFWDITSSLLRAAPTTTEMRACRSIIVHLWEQAILGHNCSLLRTSSKIPSFLSEGCLNGFFLSLEAYSHIDLYPLRPKVGVSFAEKVCACILSQLIKHCLQRELYILEGFGLRKNKIIILFWFGTFCVLRTLEYKLQNWNSNCKHCDTNCKHCNTNCKLCNTSCKHCSLQVGRRIK